MMETQISTMPEMDWLTGLSSRAAFSRHVNQADRDRDRFAIAVIEIEDFGEINRQLDYETGDELLRVVGRALAFQTSVNTFAARLGGAQFAVLAVQHMTGDLQPWISPIVDAVNEAITTWTFDVIEYSGDCPVEPNVRIGAASGDCARVWSDAATALALAQSDRSGAAVVLHDPEDPRFVTRRQRQLLTERIVAGLTSDGLAVGGRCIDVVGGRDPDWRWLRLGVVEPGPGDEPRRLIDTSAVPPEVERQLENWLVDRAGQVLTDAGSQMRVTVPLARETSSGRGFAHRLLSILERCRIPPSRMLFEVDEAVIVEAGAIGQEFSRQLERVGSGVVLSGCEGGFGAWRAIEDLPILYVKPQPDLVERAAGSDPAAARILSAIIENATARDQELIAPPSSVSDSYLCDMGFSYRERLDPDCAIGAMAHPG